jgi:spermidine/putrescine transport system ATP-binding protein
MTPDLEVVGLTKAFSGRTVLDNVSLRVNPGEFIAILGPSGSGKSTLLKITAGFEQADRGTVRLQGADVTDVPPYRRNINTVFQSYALFPHLSVFENVAYGLRRKPVREPELTNRVHAALALVDLAAFGPRAPETLSGGEQQRIALARALVNRPAVLLLDEPLSALDLKIRRRMQGELRRIHQDVGTTFLYVTHDQEEALVMADRIAVMRRGALEQVGTAREIYDHPKTPFVADFIGEMNWLPGTLVGPGTMRLDDGTMLHGQVPERTLQAGAVSLGVRPERLRLGSPDADPGPACNAMRAQVAGVTFQGAHATVTLRTGDGTELHCLRQSDGETVVPAPGEVVCCIWEAASGHLFDRSEAIAGRTEAMAA